MRQQRNMFQRKEEDKIPWLLVFPVFTYRCESWTIKKADCWGTDSFKLWCWRRFSRVSWTARRSEYTLKGLMLKLKLQYLATWYKELTHWKRPWCWEGLRAGGEGNRGWDCCMASWLNGHQFKWTLGDTEGQGRLSCCSPWGCKESNNLATEQQPHNSRKRAKWTGDRQPTQIGVRALIIKMTKDLRRRMGPQSENL